MVHHFYMKERHQTTVFQTWESDTNLPKNKPRKSVISSEINVHLFLMTEFELSSKNKNFGKLVSITIRMTNSQYQKTFLKTSGLILTNVIF